jgi:3'-phosphoadenosine 5'-phosphosulfate sulfotransferase (PAPS reductase)/FAD synthetase
MSNPYFITGPALISFSGGRTSAYMLRMILDAHGGTLPDDVHVCFANTGKEREETLRFVHECGTRWNVRVRWLEWRSRRRSMPAAERFAEVGFNSAARAGEPFKALVADKKYTPNSLARFCTEELKVNTMRAFMEAQGLTSWTNVIGLRADEMLRVFKRLAANDAGKSPWETAMPLVKGKARKPDVMAFWAAQPFDLGLADGEGNCDLCFLKSKKRLMHAIRKEPHRARDWIEMEALGKGRFVTEYSYAHLVREVASSPLLPLEPGDDDEFDAECGLWCAGEAA